MRFGITVSILLSAICATPGWAQMSPQERGHESATIKTGATNAAALFREDAAREMDERLTRHERAGRRATSGICDGCIPGARTVHQKVKPREMVGEDGLAFRAEDLR